MAVDEKMRKKKEIIVFYIFIFTFMSVIIHLHFTYFIHLFIHMHIHLSTTSHILLCISWCVHIFICVNYIHFFVSYFLSLILILFHPFPLFLIFLSFSFLGLFPCYFLYLSVHHSNNIQLMGGVPSSPQMNRNYTQGGQIQGPNQGGQLFFSKFLDLKRMLYEEYIFFFIFVFLL